MKWFLIVVFAGMSPDGFKDVYVFEEPHYTELQDCINAANDPDMIQVFVQKMVNDYQRVKDIEKVICSPEDKLKMMKNNEEEA